MLQMILQKSKLVTLLCYSLYALSPIYAVLPDFHAVNGSKDAAQQHVEHGILWLNVVVDSFVDEERTATKALGDCFQTAQHEDFVVIQKKRAMISKFYIVQPLLKVRTVAHAESTPPLPIVCAYETSHDLISRRTKGYSLLNTGLSPPLFLS